MQLALLGKTVTVKNRLRKTSFQRRALERHPGAFSAQFGLQSRLDFGHFAEFARPRANGATRAAYGTWACLVLCPVGTPQYKAVITHNSEMVPLFLSGGGSHAADHRASRKRPGQLGKRAVGNHQKRCIDKRAIFYPHQYNRSICIVPPFNISLADIPEFLKTYNLKVFIQHLR